MHNHVEVDCSQEKTPDECAGQFIFGEVRMGVWPVLERAAESQAPSTNASQPVEVLDGQA
jgi:uncharacterized protein (DUF433 family)